jgi:hypothetical protein
MELNSLPTEVILTHPRQSLGKLQLDWRYTTNVVNQGQTVSIADNSLSD